MTDSVLKPGSRVVAAMVSRVRVSDETVQWTVSSGERPEIERGAGKTND
jgi:hypothetical protein